MNTGGAGHLRIPQRKKEKLIPPRSPTSKPFASNEEADQQTKSQRSGCQQEEKPNISFISWPCVYIDCSMAATHHVSELLTKTEKKAQSEEVAPEKTPVNPVWNDKDKQPWVGRIWEHFVARLEPVCWHQNGWLWSDDPYHTEQEGSVKALPGGQTLSQGVETSTHSLNQHLVRETTSMDQQAGGLHLCLAN